MVKGREVASEVRRPDELGVNPDELVDPDELMGLEVSVVNLLLVKALGRSEDDEEVLIRLLDDEDALTGGTNVLVVTEELVAGAPLVRLLERLTGVVSPELVVLLEVRLSGIEDDGGGAPGGRLTDIEEVVMLNEVLAEADDCATVVDDVCVGIPGNDESPDAEVPGIGILEVLEMGRAEEGDVPGDCANVLELKLSGAEVADNGEEITPGDEVTPDREEMNPDMADGEVDSPGIDALDSEEDEDAATGTDVVESNVSVVVKPEVTNVVVLVKTDGTAVVPGRPGPEEGLGNDTVNPSLCVGFEVEEDLLEDVEDGEGVTGADGALRTVVDVRMAVVTCPPGTVLVSVMRILDVTGGAGLGGAGWLEELSTVTDVLVIVTVPPPGTVLVMVVKALEITGGIEGG
tara:strand:+ start:8795 stop:10006 length:1212 start_codon:yes stop_codon:yes gene_type:complete